MSDRYLLGIDLGTSSVKVLLTSADGAVLADATVEYPILQPQLQYAEQDPQDWWRAVAQATRAVMAAASPVTGPVTGPNPDIAAIGLSGQMHGVVPLDGKGDPLANAVIWPDQRSARQVAEITALVGPSRLYAIAGSPVSTGFMAASVRWFQQERPELWSRIGMLLLPKDYVRYRLTGRYATDPSDGAGSLLFDEQQRTWSAELLALLDLPLDRLPPVLPAAAVAGELSALAAAELGLPAGIPVVTGAADTACSALGAGAVRGDRLFLSLSTGGQLVQPIAEVRSDPRGRIHTFCSALEPAPGQAGWYQMGATLAAGLSLRWLRDSVFGWHYADAYDVMNVAAANTAPGADGLLFLPYLVGERTPHMDPTARGAFFGLTLRHGQGELVRAVMEGVAFACYDAYQVLAELGVQSGSIILAGGGAKSAIWRQAVADIFQKPVQPLLTSSQSALGAILLAGGGAGLFDVAATAARWAQLGPVTAPDPARAGLYAERYAAFRALYARNQGHFG